ncbi:MAG: hypothetical protein ACXW3O_07680 [Brevundimonas sp.]
MRLLSCLFGAIMLALPATAVQSQDRTGPTVVAAPDPQADPTVLDDVVVDGQTTERRAQRFVEEAARPVGGRGLARWRGPVCIGVINFRRETGYQIADGLAHAGGALGVPIADGECDPNILIIGADDARQVAAGWVEREYREFRPNIAGTTLSRARLNDFVTADIPVRWWAISQMSNFDIFGGMAQPVTGPNRVRMAVHSYSLRDSHIRDDLQRLIVILDVDKIEGASFENLIAYLTLVSFAQIDMEADMREFDTVLNLFSGSYSGAGLTAWDRAYIQSLYAVPQDLRIDADRQSRGLADQISENPEVP